VSDPGVALLDPIADARWRRFVDGRGEALAFHHPAWLELLRAEYRYPAAACCLLGRDGPVAGLPLSLVNSRIGGRRIVAVPFADLCPPLGDPAHAAPLARALDELRRRMGARLEVRGPLPAEVGADAGAPFLHHVVPLAADPAEVARGFRRGSVMQGVRRASRKGLVAEMGRDRAALAAFYRLHARTRSHQGVPTQPRSFILGLERLFEQGLGFVLLVRSGPDPVAAGVFLHHARTLVYKYGASDRSALGLRPNNLLFWEAIRWGCEHGFACLDLGRIEPAQQSLREFKLSWGAEERELRYMHLGGGVDGRRGGAALQALEAVLRRTPPAASRLAGELLYRFAG
jgi:CelD/BcsL family acetyltransferase involved in cellulose biosynthesis